MELLPDHSDELCVTPERATRCADRSMEGVRLMWNPDLPRGGHFKGAAACLSALYFAGRYEDVLVPAAGHERATVILHSNFVLTDLACPHSH